MSSMAAERTTRPARPGGRENIFTHKIGPLPMWAWLAIVLTAVLAWAWWRNRHQSQASTTANASDVPQFVNQSFVNVGPPVAHKTKDHDKDKDKDHKDDDDDHKKKKKHHDDGGGDK